MSVLFKDKITGLWRRAAAQFIHSPVPVGTVSAYGGDTAPAGYMLCHGQALNSADYPDLYDVIGTAYGTGDGSAGSFSLPDLQNKTTFGIGNAVGGLSRLGDKTVGSLPNITGSVLSDARLWGQGRTTAIGSYTEQNGALSMQHYIHNSSTQGYQLGGMAGWPGHGHDVPGSITLNASLSSSMYKATSQVVPASVGVEYIIKVTK